ncbi:MAG TPA: hypothetical protein VIX37_21105 [Candidatus Sulfotelmatobacter sp.]
MLYVVLSPLLCRYGLLLCSRVGIAWKKRGQAVLAVPGGGKHCEEGMSRIQSVVGTRAVVLNYDERESWDRWSLPAQLFQIFGLRAMPERLTPGNLPAVIVFKRLRQPRKFTFGKRSREPEMKLERPLRTRLSFDPVAGLENRGRLVGLPPPRQTFFLASRCSQQYRT